jgi:chlorophyll synthase
MAGSSSSALPLGAPAAADVLALLKPVTWFPPIWAFICGVVSSGAPVDGRWPFIVGGALLTGPLVCGASQAANDWFDRHVDAINEPDRPIPSGRVAGNWGLRIALVTSLLSIGVAATLGMWVLLATLAALAIGWTYSAPPWRLKASGVAGPASCALAYEGLTWFTGAAVMTGALPRGEIIALLLLYSAGAYGIMVLNDFKAIEGDRATGLRSLPVTMGPRDAARVACVAMALPQAVVIVLLWSWAAPIAASIVFGSLALQLAAMTRLVRDPKLHAPWYNATGVALYVTGMMAAAIGVGGLS